MSRSALRNRTVYAAMLFLACATSGPAFAAAVYEGVESGASGPTGTASGTPSAPIELLVPQVIGNFTLSPFPTGRVFTALSDDSVGFAFSDYTRPNSGVTVRRGDGAAFQFFGLDYAVFAPSGQEPFSSSMRIIGLLGGSNVGSFSISKTADPVYNFSVFGAQSLAGVDIDELQLFLPTSQTVFDDTFLPTFQKFSSAVGRIRVGSAVPVVSAVPEPATWITLMLGFGLVGASLRRRRLHSANFAI